MDPSRAIPVTIVSGFLGAGKTTLLNHLLANNQGRVIGVLVNDFGELNIDAELIAGSTKESIRLTNGCICCSIRDDLVEAVSRLVIRPDPPEHIVVETSGVSEPRPVLDTFGGLASEEVIRVDGLVTVVDAENHPSHRGSDKGLAIRQVRAADLVVLNKVDLVSGGQRARLEKSLKRLVPWARLWPATQAEVPLSLLLGLPPQEATRDSVPAPDMKAHAELRTVTLESDRALSVFDVEQAMRRIPASLFRAKGILNIAGRSEHSTILQVVGRRARLERGPPWGDASPRTQIVFIGRDPLPTQAELSELFWPGSVPPAVRGPIQRVLEFIRPRGR